MATNVLDQAQNVRGLVSAAKFRDRMALKEANATDDSQRRLYREAQFDVEERFPELKDVPVGGSARVERERNGRGPGGRSPVHEGRQRRQPGTTKRPAEKKETPKGGKSEPGRKPVPGIDPTARRRPRSTSSRSRSTSSTPRLDRAIAQTGAPAAASSTGSTVMAFLGGTVGLSLAYLVLSSAEQKGSGAAAFPTLVEGVTKGLGRFLGTGDVFSDNTRTAAAPKSTPTRRGPDPHASAPTKPHGHRAPVRLPAQIHR